MGGVNPRGRVVLIKDFLGGLLGKVRAITVPAQVELHKVSQTPRLGLRDDFPDQTRSLRVGQMPMVAQHARDQLWRPAAGTLQVDIMVEFHGQHVHIRKCSNLMGFPATKVGDITEGAGLAEKVRLGIETKSTGQSAVMLNLKRPAAQAIHRLQRLIDLIGDDQAFGTETDKCRADVLQHRVVLRMAVKRYTQALEVSERAFPPVIGVSMREHGGTHVRPGSAHRPQAAGELPRSQPRIDQHPVAAGLQQTGVPRAAAGQHCELQSHAPCSLAIVPS